MTYKEFEQEVFKEINTILNTPIQERPQYKKVQKVISELKSNLVESDIKPLWMQEAEIDMCYRKALIVAQEQDSKEMFERLDHLTSALNHPEYKHLGPPLMIRGF